MEKIKNSPLQRRILEILQTLVETPTPTGEEKRLFNFLFANLKKTGFNVEIQEEKGRFFNIVGKRKKSSLLICTHLDTFPVFSSSRLYTLRVEEGRAKARGVVDAKGQIASLLVALENTSAPCQVAFTSGEEEEALGSKFLKVRAEEGVVLEPTDFSLCLSQAGAVEIEVEVGGRSAHGSLPQEGENAILRAFEVYRKLEGLSFLRLRHPHFPEGGWVNLGRIEGGKDVMVVPDRCFFQADIGIIPGVDIKRAVDEIKKKVTESGAKVHFKDVSPPVEISPSLKVARLLKLSFKQVTGREPRIGGMPSWTDAENLFQKGIKCVVFGAGKLSSAHTECESVSLKDLEILSNILIHFLNLWGG